MVDADESEARGRKEKESIVQVNEWRFSLSKRPADDLARWPMHHVCR